MNKRVKLKIVNKLGSLFNDYYELSSFCDYLDNDINKIIKAINRIIKYAFVSQTFIKRKVTLLPFAKETEVVNVDKRYSEYLNSNKSFFDKFRKEKSINFNIPMDSDIRTGDISSLVLPTLDELKKICEDNKKKKVIKEEKSSRIKKQFNEQKGFNEVGLTYSRRDFVKLDSDFLYFSTGLSGNVLKDYQILYNDFSYDDEQVDSYKEKLNSIQASRDILLKKYGNVYEIENGKKRIIYLLRKGEPSEIYANITRRIEDREVNKMLIDLKKNSNATIYKDNVLDDEVNILIVINSIAYIIRTKEELIEFYNNIKNGKSTKVDSIPFKVADVKENKEYINEYIKLMFNKYKEKGSTFLLGSFSNALKEFDIDGNSVFYEAFLQLQRDFRDSIIFQTNFEKEYETILNFDNRSNTPESNLKQPKR